MNILHATTAPPMLERLKQMLASAHKADIAVGYLFVSGFGAVAEELAKLEKVRVLVGRIDRQTLEQVARGLQQAEALRARLDSEDLIKRSQRQGLGAEAVRTIAEGVSRLPQTDEAQFGVKRMCDLVASEQLEIRSYPKATMHAKAYLCWYKGHAEKGSAIVGSSNFSLSGFEGNTELNVRVTGDAEMEALGGWFEGLWADSVDVSTDVLVELRRSWALDNTPPYHVYLKALYELYQDELDAPELKPKSRQAPELANFQLDAVRRALLMIELHGGCFIGDVVGLGKTYVGAEIVRQLQFTEPRGRNPIIVCPAGLKPMWEVVNERFGLGAAVISMSAIVPPPMAQFDEEAGVYIDADFEGGPGIDLLATYPNRGVVLVDEAHNFRNEAARRYQALSRYLQEGEHKVVLLSATPQNLGPADIYHQLRLFLDDLDHGIDLEPLHLRDYFRAVQQWYQYRLELENWEADYRRWQAEASKARAKISPAPRQPERPSTPKATIEEVLNPVFIRRRRKDIRELYGDAAEVNGKRVQFPEPKLENVPYLLDKVYAKAGKFTDIQAALKKHQGARYLPVDYLRPAARTKPQYRDLLRARNRIASLMRHLLFKRLESSVAAFRATLDVLIRSNVHFRDALESGFVPIGQTATQLLSGEQFDVDELLVRLEKEEQRRAAAGERRAQLVHPTTDFDLVKWLADLDSDRTVLETLRVAVDRVTPKDDDKLQAIKAYLKRPEVAGDKVLIFSEAEATVNYLYEQLNPGGKDPSIEHLSGSNRENIQAVIKRFAPSANLRDRERLPGPEIRVLIATDVISEGQNLQDCNRVLNYDLHWNPVRLIQRFGRVDRIGTTHEVIYLNNTWPDLQVDAELSLTERLINRIQAFHDFIGLDMQLLSKTERINPNAMYRIYEQQRLPDQDDVLEEVAGHQRGIALLQRLQQEDPDLWAIITKLPDGIRSALATRTSASEERALVSFQEAFEGTTVQYPLGSPRLESGIEPTPFDVPEPRETVVLFKHGERSIAYAVGSELRPRSISLGQLISAMECERTTPAAVLAPDTNQRVHAAYEATRRDAEARLGRDRRPGSDTQLRRYLSRELRAERERHSEDADELGRIGLLQQIFLDYLPPPVVSELEEVRRMTLTGASLVRRLEALRDRYRLNPSEPDEQATAGAEPAVVRIVCSDGLVSP
ncbi:MAG TPA: helicase-related protein [Chloroflexota bacterium]|nr:helicase-related protein [Chloroflexota bacterium]